MLRNKHQNIVLHTLISKLGIDSEEKRSMIREVSKGREESSARLTMEECQSLINHLNAKQSVKPSQYQQRYENDPTDKQRKKIISICYEMKWTVNGKIDYSVLNAWLLKYGKFHKALNDLNESELPATISQFEELLKKYYAKR